MTFTTSAAITIGTTMLITNIILGGIGIALLITASALCSIERWLKIIANKRTY